jgi:hypothetical protein
MEPDPLIDEIHEIRRQISAEFGHDPRRLIAHYMEMERRLKAEGKYRFVNSPLGREERADDLVLREKPKES